ncbi:MAG: helicase C-terminal domain-containing protein [bacterium]|nr:helicase C-terminal domain-containing protein [bacterium]
MTTGFFPFPDAVILDCETTGLDPEKDAVIEIGAVRIAPDGTERRWESLFNPGIPIPASITLLTGISDSDCAGRPSIRDALPDFWKWMEGAWVIGHQVSFDLSFLSAERARSCPDLPPVNPGRVIDTLELSRLLFPFLPNHRLETIAASLGVDPGRQHRALDDAAATAAVFRAMIGRLLELDAAVVNDVRRMLNGAGDGLRFLFDDLAAIPGRKPKDPEGTGPAPVNVLGARVPLRGDGETETIRMDPGEVSAFFSPEGPLAGRMTSYEPRKSQVEMAAAVARAFNEDGILVAEAGTGVGKSLAYLVPAVFWAQANPADRVVIATATKTLQDQLFYKDIPQVMASAPKSFCAVLLKGRSNYLCPVRYRTLMDRIEDKLPAGLRRRLIPLALWRTLTRTGDIEENPGFHRDSAESLWTLVNSESSRCAGAACGDSACHVQNVHRAAKSANLLVINHALLFSSIGRNRSSLGEFETLVLDEAHQIEKSASQHLGVSLQPSLFSEIAGWLHHAKPSETGLLVSLKRVISDSVHGLLPDSDPDRSITDRLREAAHDLTAASGSFFRDLGAIPALASAAAAENARWTRVRLRRSPASLVPASFEGLLQAVGRLRFQAGDALNRLRIKSLDRNGEGEALSRELGFLQDRLSDLEESISHFRKADPEKHALWCEWTEHDGRQELVLRSVPVDIASLLANRLFPRLKRAVLTSATLTVDERFDYLMFRWGLNWLEADRITARAFGSPFNFHEQSLLLVPTYLSHPKDGRFTRDLADLLVRLHDRHKRGTLVLFTSYAMLRSVREAVLPSFEERGVRLLAQGTDGSRTTLLRAFRERPGSVLLGTSSFWEGVDVPGPALELLVITKIPFDVPTDPLIEARMEKIQSDSGNGFLNYAVPEAVFRLRQGFGRLIRTAEDRGAVLMLDPRTTRTPYGSMFLNSLPVDATLCGDESALFSALDQWFTSN